MPNLILPKYTGTQPLERFINQMESLLRSSGVPFNSGSPTLISNAKRTAGLMTPLPKPKLLLQQLWVQTLLQQLRNNPGEEGTLNAEVVGMLVGMFFGKP